MSRKCHQHIRNVIVTPLKHSFVKVEGIVRVVAHRLQQRFFPFCGHLSGGTCRRWHYRHVPCDAFTTAQLTLTHHPTSFPNRMSRKPLCFVCPMLRLAAAACSRPGLFRHHIHAILIIATTAVTTAASTAVSTAVSTAAVSTAATIATAYTLELLGVMGRNDSVCHLQIFSEAGLHLQRPPVQLLHTGGRCTFVVLMLHLRGITAKHLLGPLQNPLCHIIFVVLIFTLTNN
mmetsp:Transcript_28052/g.47408  ORF Transcript_28052/g.47408 Transcript_28052/m.47408 type:complete len:231 (+) Transcript_28052:230-922(+)